MSEKPFRVIVTGSRDWMCDDLADHVLDRLISRHGRDRLVVVEGGAPGVDGAFARAATRAGVRVETHQADWDRYGRGAGPKRNGEMVRAGADLCVAVHWDIIQSKGTADCVLQAVEAGIPVVIVETFGRIFKPSLTLLDALHARVRSRRAAK